MIISVSPILSHPKLKDFFYVLINRQEPEIDNNIPYVQKVMGSKDSVKWFRNNALTQMYNQQHTR